MSLNREEMKALIREQLGSFVPNVVKSDIDSAVFDDNTALKIQELSKQFPIDLVQEVMTDDYYKGNFSFTPKEGNLNPGYLRMLLNGNVIAPAELGELCEAVDTMFAELVTPHPEQSGRLIKDVDAWIKTTEDLKSKYNVPAFEAAYNSASIVYDVMWSLGFSKEQAIRSLIQVSGRQHLVLTDADIKTILKGSSIGAEEFQFSQFTPDPNRLTYWGSELEEMEFGKENICHQPLIENLQQLGRSLSIRTNRSSGGYGHDITTNGGGRKKVVTGKAGNKYPVPKRRGVR